MTSEQRFGGKEYKFLVREEQAEAVRAWARANLDADPHAEAGDQYRITSLYCDTPEFHVLRRAGSYGRAKYRIRRYGQAETAFLERKLKTSCLVAKRRSEVVLDRLPEVLAGPWDEEAGWFQRRLHVRGLRPVCAITYSRTARIGRERGRTLRLTVDAGLSSWAITEPGFAPLASRPVYQGRQVVEMKFSGEMPLLFKDLIRRFLLERTSMSKYRAAGEVLGLAEVYA